MSTTLDMTDFHFPGQKKVYHGKVRDVYDFGDTLLLVTTDRYSAFDRNLALVPYKGELVTAITRWWFEQTASIIKNHVIDYPDPHVVRCKKYQLIPIEMVVRGYITGVTSTSLWHTYSAGQRDYGDFTLPDGLCKNDKLPHPVLTPTTKLEAHDRNLTPDEAVAEGLVDKAVWEQLQSIAIELFTYGQKTAEKAGLMLVDTKYEFGLDTDGSIVLIDEIHTPDSSRFWLADTYKTLIDQDKEPDNYDKEFLRLWFNERFDPYSDAPAPAVPDEIITELSNRYMYVYKRLSGTKFKPANDEDLIGAIESNVKKVLAASA